MLADSFSWEGSGLTSEVSGGYSEWLHSYYGGLMSANHLVAKKRDKNLGLVLQIKLIYLNFPLEDILPCVQSMDFLENVY